MAGSDRRHEGAARGKEGVVSDEEMEKLPQRSIGGVDKKTSARTMISGLIADIKPLIQRLLGRFRRK